MNQKIEEYHNAVEYHQKMMTRYLITSRNETIIKQEKDRLRNLVKFAGEEVKALEKEILNPQNK